MALEEIKRQKYNYKIDIWSLGCVIHELCTLEICFQNPQNITEGRYKKINVNYYGNFLQNLIDVLLNQDYHKRPNACEIIDFINKKEIPRTMTQQHSHHNNNSNSDFGNNEEFRAHSTHSSPNRFGSSHHLRSHRHHHRRNFGPSFSNISHASAQIDPQLSKPSYFPLDNSNKASHGISHSNSFILHGPSPFPKFPHLMPNEPRIFEQMKPPYFIQPGHSNIKSQNHFMPSGPHLAPPPPQFIPPQGLSPHFMPAGPHLAPLPPQFAPPGHEMFGPILPPPVPPFF